MLKPIFLNISQVLSLRYIGYDFVRFIYCDFVSEWVILSIFFSEINKVLNKRTHPAPTFKRRVIEIMLQHFTLRTLFISAGITLRFTGETKIIGELCY